MKVQISIHDELLERVDKVSKDNYMSRSGFIAVALTQYLNSQELTSAIRDLSLAMVRISKNGDVDEETKKELENFEAFAKMLTSV